MRLCSSLQYCTDVLPSAASCTGRSWWQLPHATCPRHPCLSTILQPRGRAMCWHLSTHGPPCRWIAKPSCTSRCGMACWRWMEYCMHRCRRHRCRGSSSSSSSMQPWQGMAAGRGFATVSCSGSKCTVAWHCDSPRFLPNVSAPCTFSSIRHGHSLFTFALATQIVLHS